MLRNEPFRRNRRQTGCGVRYKYESLAADQTFHFEALDMFFKLLHPEFPGKPLHGTVSSDGVVFFRATDVARLLKYKDCSHFAAKHAKAQIKDIVYKRMDLEHPSVLRTWVFCRVKTAYYLDNGTKADTCSFANVLLDWDKVRVSVPRYGEPSTKMREAVPCVILPDDESGDMTLKEFIEDFTTKTLEMYENLSRDENDNIMHVHQPSLKVLEMDEPPETIRMFFDSKAYTYRLSLSD